MHRLISVIAVSAIALEAAAPGAQAQQKRAPLPRPNVPVSETAKKAPPVRLPGKVLKTPPNQKTEAKSKDDVILKRPDITAEIHTIPLYSDHRLLNAETVDEWIEQIPDWTRARRKRPNSEKKSNAGGGTEKHGDRNYTVTRTKYSITETPEEIVTFQPVNGFWLGGLVQEKGLQLGLGSMQQIDVEAGKRAPFKISSDLPIANNFRQISSPSATSVSSAIGSLLSSNARSGGARTLTIVDNYTEEQTAHALGLNASYMSANLKTAFKSDRFNSKHTITAAFIERAVTLQADFEGRSRRAAFFQDNFTIDDARGLTQRGVVTVNNLPTYIKSITYGRVVIFNLTSTLSESEMRAALNASASGASFSVNANYQGSERLKNALFELRVTTLGGGQDAFGQLIPAKGITNVLQVMNNYLKKPAPLSSMVPISYTANSMRDDQLAALSRTTEYTVTQYVPNPIGERYRLKMWVTVLKSNDGFLDNTLECYGTLRVNGDVWWEIPRSAANANQREKGQTIEISDNAPYRKRGDFTFDYFYDARTRFNLDLNLFDRDESSSDDRIGRFVQTLDLRSLAGNTKTWDWDSGDGEATRLHLRVERISFL